MPPLSRPPPSPLQHTFTHTLTHTHTHSLTHPPTHSPTHPLTHSLTDSLTHSRGRRSTDSFLAAFGVAGAVHRASWRNCCACGRRWAAATFRVVGAVHRASWTSCGVAWPPLGRGCLSCGKRSTQSLLEEMRRAWPQWAAAAFRVAGAVHRASRRSCGARGRCWAAAAFRVAGVAQSLLDELRRAWSPLGRGCLSCDRRKYTELPGGAAARVAAAGPRLPFVWHCGARGRRWAAAAFCVAGAVHRASRRNCGARGRRWAAAAFSCGRRNIHRASWRSCGARGRRWAAAAFYVAGAVHRASRRSCGGRGRRLASAAFRVAGAIHRASWRRCASHHFSNIILATLILTYHLSHTQLCHTPSFTHHQHHLSHTIFDTPSCTHTTLLHTILYTLLYHTLFFTHRFVPHRFVPHHLSHHFFTHHLSHTTLSHTTLSHTIFYTPFVTQYFLHTTLSHTIFNTTSLTYTIFHTPSKTIFHTPSFTHPHHLSHTIFDTPSFTHNFVTHYLSPYDLYYAPFFTTPSFTQITLLHTMFPPPLPLSFLFSPSPQQHFLLIIGRN